MLWGITRPERAANYFGGGQNCGQSDPASFAPLNRSFHHEGLSLAGADLARRKEVRFAINEAMAEARKRMVLAWSAMERTSSAKLRQSSASSARLSSLSASSNCLRTASGFIRGFSPDIHGPFAVAQARRRASANPAAVRSAAGK